MQTPNLMQTFAQHIGVRAVCTYCFARLVFARTSDDPPNRDVVSRACPRCGNRVHLPTTEH